MSVRIQSRLACALLVATVLAGPVVAEADPVVSREIDRVVTAIVGAGAGEGTEEVLARIERLERAVDGDRERLLLELAAYLSTADGTEQAMGAALLLDHLRFSSEEIVRAVAPRIGTDDAPLERVYRELLATVDRPTAGEPDFAAYVIYLRSSRVDPPAPLIDYLYSIAPAAGLAALAEVYARNGPERDEFQRAAEAVRSALAVRGETAAGNQADARARLEALSRSDVWWVRSFVGRILEIAPELGSPEIHSRLEASRR
jgi:hypothetical protein